jgi:nicotinamidase-related amidase
MALNRENTIGLVIDMQEKILPIIDNQEEIIKNSLALLKGLTVLQIPILVTQQNTKNLGSTIADITGVIDNFSYIDKMTFSCYHEPAFVKILNHIGKKNVIIIGIEAHVCVLQTVLDLASNNFIPVIIEDCIGSSSSNDKQISLWRMRGNNAIISTWESVLMEICHKAGTDEFRALLRIIKERKNA